MSFRIGQRVSVLSPFDRRIGERAREGVIVGAAIQSDPQGIEGTITVDLGNGCHEYAPPSWLEPVAPYATFAFHWAELGGPQYTVHGGRYDRSTLSAQTLQELGIEVRE